MGENIPGYGAWSTNLGVLAVLATNAGTMSTPQTITGITTPLIGPSMNTGSITWQFTCPVPFQAPFVVRVTAAAAFPLTSTTLMRCKIGDVNNKFLRQTCVVSFVSTTVLQYQFTAMDGMYAAGSQLIL